MDIIKKELASAKRHLAKAMALFRNSHDKFGEASTSLWLSKLHWIMDDASAAEKELDRCLILAAGMGASELLMDGRLEIGLRALQKKSCESAVKNFALANHFAEELGTQRYDKFLSQIRSHLEALRQFSGRDKAELTATRIVREWTLKEDYLPGPVEKEELHHRIRQLLNAPASDLSAGAGFEPSLHEEAEDPFAQKVRRIIEEHLQDPDFEIKDLCREVGMSHSQLHRRLSKLTGRSAAKFIRSLRLSKAKELLSDPELTVAAVAYDTGFRDPDYFHRVFKQAFNMTPGEFRKSKNT